MTLINRPKFEKPVVRRNFRQNPRVTKKEREVLDSIFAICDCETTLKDLPEIKFILIKDNWKILCYVNKLNSLRTKPNLVIYPAYLIKNKLNLLLNETLYTRI